MTLTASRFKNLLLVSLLIVPGLIASGCSNVGDENPVTPEKMQEIRKSQDSQRRNFNPGTSQSPGAGGAAPGTR